MPRRSSKVIHGNVTMFPQVNVSHITPDTGVIDYQAFRLYYIIECTQRHTNTHTGIRKPTHTHPRLSGFVGYTIKNIPFGDHPFWRLYRTKTKKNQARTLNSLIRSAFSCQSSRVSSAHMTSGDLTALPFRSYPHTVGSLSELQNLFSCRDVVSSRLPW